MAELAPPGADRRGLLTSSQAPGYTGHQCKGPSTANGGLRMDQSDNPSEAVSFGQGVGAGALGHPRGRTAAPLQVEATRPITPADMVALNNTPVGSKTPPLAKLRESHHNVARLLAQGHQAVEVSAMTGMSQSRISILRKDPMFAELISFYETRRGEVLADLGARIQTMALDALQELQSRIEDAGQAIPIDQLQKLVFGMLDRAGHGPMSTRKNVNTQVLLTAQDLEHLKRQVSEAHAGKITVRGAQGPVLDIDPNTGAVRGTPEPGAARAGLAAQPDAEPISVDDSGLVVRPVEDPPALEEGVSGEGESLRAESGPGAPTGV